jgi:hypothetical protein
VQIKYVDHMENDQVKECWHQNVTQCHDSYITGTHVASTIDKTRSFNCIRSWLEN